MVKDASGEWRYAVSLDSAGRPVPSSREVGRDEPPVAAKVLHAQVMARAQASHTDEVASPGSGRGKQRLLVLLVSFADQGPVGSTEATWADRYFGRERERRCLLPAEQLQQVPAASRHRERRRA